MSTNELFVGGNDNYLQISGLKNGADGTYINDASITATLYDETGAQVTGMTWPAALSYIAASNGNYQLQLTDALSLQAGKYYKIQVDAASGGLNARWTINIKAQTRS